MESKIEGGAVAIFGGKIGCTVYQTNFKEPHVIFSMEELKEKIEIGERAKEENFNNDAQIFLVFQSLESIGVVEANLLKAKEILKNQLKE